MSRSTSKIGMRRLLLTSMLVLVAAGLGACGSTTTSTGGTSGSTETTISSRTTGSSRPSGPSRSTGSTAPSGPASASSLAGRTFLSESVTEGATPRTVVGNGTTPGRFSLQFIDTQRLSANAGCNSMGGTYAIRNERLVIGDLATTLIGCPEAIAVQEQWLGQFLRSSPTISLDGERLTLASGTQVVVFTDREVADPDRALVGAPWVVDTVFGTGGTASSSASGFPPTVTFAGDGTLTYTDTCAGGRAKWSRRGDQITFTDRQSNPTFAACPPSDNPADDALAKTLQGTSTIAIDGPTMTLKRGDEGIGLRS